MCLSPPAGGRGRVGRLPSFLLDNPCRSHHLLAFAHVGTPPAFFRLNSMIESQQITGLRTHRCGELRAADFTAEAVLMGWVATRRDHGGVIFADLRDHTGIVQVVFKPEVNATAHGQADALRSEYVIAVRGRVAPREEGNVNPKLATGEVEVLVDVLEILNVSKPPLYSWDEEADERLRMKHRYFDLRRPSMQAQAALPGLATGARIPAGAGLRGNRDARPHPRHSRGGAGLSGALPGQPRQFLRTAPIAAVVQAAVDGGRVRPLFPDRKVLPGRRPARQPPAGIHPD